MLSSLLWKSWRELRTLRWGGAATAFLLPMMLLVGAEAARRGWLPFGRVSSYTTGTVMFELAPGVLAGLVWPLLTLLLAAQAFAGDRAEGTEGFLLERPVPRTRTWWARLGATAGSALVVAAAGAAGCLVFGLFLAGSSSPELSNTAAVFGLGLLAIAAALMGGAVAGSIVRAPLAAVLLGLILGGIPFGMAAMLDGMFPLARYKLVSAGMLAPWVLLGGYGAVSWIVLCRGEPAGRGRVLRGTVALVVALVAVPAAFAVAAPLVIRQEAARLSWGAQVYPSPDGRTLVAGSSGGMASAAWFFDLGSGRELRFLDPPIRDVAWSPDGTRVAVLTDAGRLGSLSWVPRIDFLDPAGHPVGSVVVPERHGWIRSVRWSRDRLLLQYFASRDDSGLLVADPTTGEVVPMDFRQRYLTWALVGPTEGGDLFVARETEGERSDVFAPYVLQRIDAASGTLDPEPVVEDHGRVSWAPERLSPAGRYWIVDDGSTPKRPEDRPIRDLVTGEEIVVEGFRFGRWLAGDRLVWSEATDRSVRLMLLEPGASPRRLREWDGAPDLSLSLAPSPDLARLLVVALRPVGPAPREAPPAPGEAPASLGPGYVIEASEVWDVRADRWTDLGPWPERLGPGAHYGRRWAGPETLARTGKGYLGLERLDAPGEAQDLVGRYRPRTAGG